MTQKPFTSKQRRYIELRALGVYSGAECARQAGYSVHSARLQAFKLDTKPHIAAAIEEHAMAISARHRLDEDFVIDRLISLADNADTSASQIRALDLLGRHLRMFGNDRAADAPVSFADELESLSDEIRVATQQATRLARA